MKAEENSTNPLVDDLFFKFGRRNLLYLCKTAVLALTLVCSLNSSQQKLQEEKCCSHLARIPLLASLCLDLIFISGVTAAFTPFFSV